MSGVPTLDTYYINTGEKTYSFEGISYAQNPSCGYGSSNSFSFKYYSDSGYTTEIAQPSYVTAETFNPPTITVNSASTGDAGTIYVKLTNTLTILAAEQSDTGYLS